VNADGASEPDAIATDGITDADATTTVDSTATDAITDATTTVDSTATDAITDKTDADVTCKSSGATNCPCTRVFPTGKGVESLDCYCGRSPIPTCFGWDLVRSCLDIDRFEEIVFDTYESCNLVTVSYFVSGLTKIRVYDATTHALVGAGHSTSNSYCGSELVGVIEAGIFPAPCCTITKTERPCHYIGPDPLPEPGRDASDVDADASWPDADASLSDEGGNDSSPDSNRDASGGDVDVSQPAEVGANANAP
jgi:hypothetical protein